MPTEAIEDIGTVIAVNGSMITVEICKSGGCKSCGLKGLCGSGKTSQILSFETNESYRIGDKVVVSVSSGVRILSSIIVFIFPLLGLFGFFLLGRIFLSEPGAIGLGFAGMVIAFLVVKLLDKLIGRQINFSLGGKYEDMPE